MSLFTVVLLSDALVVPAYSSAIIPWEQGKVARGLVPRGEEDYLSGVRFMVQRMAFRHGTIPPSQRRAGRLAT